MRVIPFPITRWALPLILAVTSLPLAAPSRGADATQRIDLGGGSGLELIRIEAGRFQQGSPTTETPRGTDETPRPVTLTQPFYLGKYPVTRGEFTRFVGETRYRTEAEAGTSGGYGWDGTKLAQRKEFTWKNPGFPQTDAHPVVLVTYADARAFLAWLSRKTGRAFSLPTEAQWEYACRAGSTTAFPPGTEVRLRPSVGTQIAGQAPLNTWGLGDMNGNVWQWCEDWYAPYAPGSPSDPQQTQSNLSDKPRRVLRGGSWLRPAADLRSAARYRNDPASRNADNGFRVVTFDATPAANPPPTTATERPRIIQHAAPAEPDRVIPALPAVTQPAHSFHENPAPPARRSFGFLRLLFPVLILFLVVAVIVKVIRAISKTGATGVVPGHLGSTGSSPLRTRIVDDGFWIESASLPAGTVLECRYSAGGKQNQSNVTFQGGTAGQFVFTGSRPSSVAVAVLPGGGPSRSGGLGGSPLGRAAGMMTGLHQPPPLPDHDDEPRRQSRSHPPAY